MLSSKPPQLVVQGLSLPSAVDVEYFRLLRSQIKDGDIKDVTHLDTLGILKERISTLEQEQVLLRCTNTGAQKTIKDLEDGIPESPRKKLGNRKNYRKRKIHKSRDHN